MKKPRINDFDPHATPIPSLNSPLENFPVIEQPQHSSTTPNKNVSIPDNSVSDKERDTVMPRYHDTTQPRHHATTTPGRKEDLIEAVRKATKRIGKEAATHRFTLEEKQMLADIEYQYKRQGIRTSENEITRIAINYFAEEYKQYGEKSILAQVLKKLNS